MSTSGSGWLVDVGEAKGQLYQGQPAIKWGTETEIEVRAVATANETREFWYDTFRDYQQYVGADAFGRLDGGEPWVRDASESSWPVPSNVVQITAGSEYRDFDDVWALLTDIEDESEIPFVYRFTITFVPLAFASEYASRTDLLDALPTPTIQL